jgi:hypothetical protein
MKRLKRRTRRLGMTPALLIGAVILDFSAVLKVNLEVPGLLTLDFELIITLWQTFVSSF